jgi:hypothetical protein
MDITMNGSYLTMKKRVPACDIFGTYRRQVTGTVSMIVGFLHRKHNCQFECPADSADSQSESHLMGSSVMYLAPSFSVNRTIEHYQEILTSEI